MPAASLFSVWLSEAQELHEFAPELQQTEFEHDPAAVAAEKPGVICAQGLERGLRLRGGEAERRKDHAPPVVALALAQDYA